MKRKLSILLLCLLLCAGIVTAAGDSNDPLVSLSYLNGVYLTSIDRLLQGKLETVEDSLQQDSSSQLQNAVSSLEVRVHSDYAPVFQESRLNQGDTISGNTGMSVILLAGQVQAYFTSGTVIDITAGRPISSGTLLSPQHRYLAAEDTSVTYHVTSKTAVAQYEGYYLLHRSTATDYCAMADALKTLGLFRGSDTGYGGGFNLEQAPTRIQAVIMLLRSLGEEEAALQCTDTHPYTDVPEWCDRYVAYAHRMGYTNGVSPTRFAPNSTVTAVQFMEFMLRSTGYSIAGTDDWSRSLERAKEQGVITAGEYTVYTQSDFLRADCAYLFFYLLNTPIKTSGTALSQRLIQAGLFNEAQLYQARAMVKTPRIA